MTTVGPVPPALPPAPTPTATTGAPGAVGAGAVPTPSAPTVTATAVQALTAIVVNLPNTLRNRPVGSPIVGTLVAQDSNGTALLRTPEGTVVLRGPIAAQIGSQLALYLPEQAEGATARLVLQRLPDGAAATGVTAGTAAKADTPTPGGASGATVQGGAPSRPAPAPLTQGQVVTATLVQREDAASAAPNTVQAGYARAPIGATFGARVLSIANPAAGAANKGSMGINVEGHPVVTATVVGRTTAGQLAVSAGFGLLTIPAGGDLQPGQRLELELLGRPAATPRPAPSALPQGQVVTATLVERGDAAQGGSSSAVASYARAPIGTAFDARVLSVVGAANSAASGAAISINAEGRPVVTATVVGRTGAGLVVVNAGFGLLTLPASGNLLPGQRVQLELLGRSGAAPSALSPGQVVTTTLVQRGDAALPGANGATTGYMRAPIGATFDARVLSIAPAIEGAPGMGAMSVNAEGHPVVTAAVVGRTGAGLLVVNAGFGLLTVPAGGELLPGQRLQLELLGRPGAATAPTPGLLPPAAEDAAAAGDAVTLAHDWENLRRTIEALAANDPQAAQSAIGRAVAQPGERLAAGLLFLMAALRGGDVGMLLGERAVRALERTGRGALLNRLSDELGVLNRLATQPSGDWRAFFLPVQHPEGPITPVRMFFRQQRNRKGQLEPTTRFVVETELTRLGPLQIDGLARAQRVDLILRTRELLPEQARQDIDAIVQSAAAEGRFAGSIAFQAVDRFPIDPLDEIGHPAHGVTA